MNYNKIIKPFTLAIANTTGNPLPQNPVLLDVSARRFLADNVMSEMIEYLVADTEVDRIDAIVDAIIYVTDTCIRFGVEPYLYTPSQYEPLGLADTVWGHVGTFVRAETLDAQRHCLGILLQRLARGHTFDLTPFVKEVAKANLQKIGSDGLVTLNERGKVLKPKNFISPDLSQTLEAVKNGTSG